MLLLMKNENTGYTRKKDMLSIDTRRRKRKEVPMPLDDFERLVLKTINHYNLYTNKKRLRTTQMRSAGVGIIPVDIFKYTQKLRRGDAARIFTEREIYDRFIPWVGKACRKGLIFFGGARYFSDELTEYFNEYVKSPGDVANPMIWVKRVSGSSKKLYWRKTDQTIGVLEMTEEDQKNLDLSSWKGMELSRYDDIIQESKLSYKRTRSRGQLKVTQHEKVVAAERGRSNPIAGLQGPSVKLARHNASEKREKERGTNEFQAYGVNDEGYSVKLGGSITKSDEVDRFESDIYGLLGLT